MMKTGEMLFSANGTPVLCEITEQDIQRKVKKDDLTVQKVYNLHFNTYINLIW
jgi:hypothetical protein